MQIQDMMRLSVSKEGAARLHREHQKSRYVLNREVVREVRTPEDVHGTGLHEDEVAAAWQLLRSRPHQRMWLVRDHQARSGMGLLVARAGAEAA